MKKDWKTLLVCLAIPLAAGGLGALLAGSSMKDYAEFIQPPFSPPGWVFPVVWTILYLLMGYGSYRVLTFGQDTAAVKKALLLYAVQLVVNLLWPLLFFRLKLLLISFFWLVLLWVLVFLTLRAFSKIEEKAGNALLPYLLWVTFAGYLNFGIFVLNR